MKCQICDKFFVSETKFKNMFVFEEICNDCKKVYEIAPKTEVFPLNKGLVEYMYLYEDESVNYKQKEYLSKNYNLLFQNLSNEDKNKLVVIVDDFTYEDLEKELEYIEGFKRVIFMSLFRYEFDGFVKLY